MTKYLKNTKNATHKRHKLDILDVWDKPGGGTRDGEREYRKEGRKYDDGL